MNGYSRPALRVWWIALAVKITLAVWLPLSNDEAYYWVWGHHPDWSYFDHPGMVGWLFTLGTFLENLGNGARIPGVILGHLTLLIWWKILAPWLDERKQTAWLLLMLFSPFVGIGSLVITPDVPLLFFWSLSLYFFLNAIEKPNARNYLALGAALGLGFCSKYPIVLFVPIALVWLVVSRKLQVVRWSLVPLTVISGLLCCFPVLYWNSQHEWASFGFQLNHGLSNTTTDWHWPVEFLAGQIALVFPLLAWLTLQRREPEGARFLRYFGWLPVLFFTCTAFRARPEANWALMAHPALLSLAFLNLKNERWLKITIGIWAACALIVFSEIAYPWLPIEPKRLKTTEFTRYDIFVPEAQLTSDPELYLGSYQMAASVSYKLRRQFYKLGGMNRRDFYDFTPQSYPHSASFRIGAEKNQALPEWLEKGGFKVVGSKSLGDEFQILEVRKRAQGSDQ